MCLYENILIPVADDTDIFISIRKALDIKDETQPIKFHFVRFSNHKKRLNIFKNIFKSEKTPQIRQSYNPSNTLNICRNIENNYPNVTCFFDPEIQINTEAALSSFLVSGKIDLLILCEKKFKAHFHFLNKRITNRIVLETSCSILNVPENGLHQNIRSIILPVSSYMPQEKIKIALSFAQKNKGLIHLVTLLDNNNSNDSKKRVEIFYKTYKILKECGHAPQYKILEKPETEEALLEYAQRINADLVLLNPKKSGLLETFFGKDYKTLAKNSLPIHILTSNPFLSA